MHPGPGYWHTGLFVGHLARDPDALMEGDLELYRRHARRVRDGHLLQEVGLIVVGKRVARLPPPFGSPTIRNRPCASVVVLRALIPCMTAPAK